MTRHLFDPVALGPLALPNRIVMAPMTRNRASASHLPTPIMAAYYAQRAEAGLLITEGTAPTPSGCGYARIPGLWSEEQVAAWRVVTDAVHDRGGRIAVQLMHTGRVGHPDNQPPGARLLAPSAVPLDATVRTAAGPLPCPTPLAMTEAQIEAALDGFAQAARNARAAGFDLVELHGANGYLIEQFLAPCTNQRTDRWGGDLPGRARFAIEVARRVGEAIGADRVGMRLSPLGVVNRIRPWPGVPSDYAWLAEQLGGLDLATLHLVDHRDLGGAPVPSRVARKLRRAFSGAFILSGGYDRARADADLAADKGDLVAFGRAFLANPDLVERLRRDAPLNVPDHATFYSGEERGYLDYPTLS